MNEEVEFTLDKDGKNLANVAPQEFKIYSGPVLPTLYIKTPVGVTFCGNCNETAVAEFWIHHPPSPERYIGKKCLWCDYRS